MLGYINDTTLHLQHVLAASGGLLRSDAAVVNRRLQRTLHNHDGNYQDPLERIAARDGRQRRAPHAGSDGRDSVPALTLRIALAEMPEPVWRQLIVPATASLEDLSEALTIAFGWAGYHLSGFWTDAPWRGRSFATRVQVDEFDDDGEATDTITVDEALGRIGARLHWVYDYGDGQQM